MTDFSNTYKTTVANAAVDAEVAKLLEGLEEPTPAAAPTAPEGGTDTGESIQAVTPVNDTDDQGFISDVGNFLMELPMQLVGGVGDAIDNTVDAARSAGQALGIPNYALQFTNEQGDIDITFLSDEEVEAAGGLSPGLLPEVGEAETAAGGMVRAITTFAAGFLPAAKGLKAAGMASTVARGMTAGAVADAVAMDPHQARLATMLNQVPVLESIIPDYMADNDPANESEWEGRIKNAIEGVALGGISEVAIRGAAKMFKGYKASAAAKKAMVKEGVTPEDALKTIDEIDATKAAADEEFIQPITAEELVTKEPKGDFFINTNRIKSTKDIDKVLKNAAEAQSVELSKGTKTFKGIKEASKTEMKNVNDLLDRPTTRPFTAEEAVAARDTLTASAESLSELGKVASGMDASPAALYNFREALALHNDIQTKVFGGRKATAQSLASWRITSKSDAARGKAIASLLEGNVGDIQKMAKGIADVANNGGNVSKMAGELTSGKWKDAYYQVWINGLLSSPATHGANAISNMGTTLMAIPERYVTAGFEKMMGANGSAFLEANARATGFFSGVSDGFKLMTGKNINEKLIRGSKLEVEATGISAASWGKQPDSVVGMGLDYIGKAINMPGWALEKGDMFFKGINYRMMLNEKSAKQAFEEGLTGKAFQMRVDDLVMNPSEAMQDVASDFAKYQTFTNQAGDIAGSVRKGVSATPGGKFVVPFIRTPANILSYGFERTPLAPAMGKVREAIAAGGSQRAEALARMSAGSMVMAGVSALTLNGMVTGAGPSNYKERIALEKTGWQPYSVKIGDTYVAYDRLEPIASIAGYAADITSIMGQLGEDESGELVAAGLAAFAKNLTNKTFLSGAAQFVDVVTSNSPKKWEKYSQRMAAGFVHPIGSSAAKKFNNYIDPEKRDYTVNDDMGYLKSIFHLAAENVPGMGKSAPMLRDIWGEPQKYSHGVSPALDAISPIRMSMAKDDPVSKMISDNNIALSLPSRLVKGVQLTNKEYEKYTKLAGRRAKEFLDEEYAYGAFDNLTGSPDGEIALAIKNVMSRSRAWAREQLIMDSPELEDRIWADIADKERKLLGE